MAGEPPPSAPWAAPAPPPAAWMPPRRPRPRRRRVWIYLLVGAVVLIIGLALASGTIWVQKVKPPIDAANAYLRDISHRNYAAAFRQMCPRERVDGSPRSLADTVDRLAAFGVRDYEISPFDVHIDGTRATVKADLHASNFNDADTVRIQLEKIDGDWRPCGGQFGFVDDRLTSSAI